MATEITRETDRHLTTRELSERTGISESSLEQWRMLYNQVKQGPPWITLGDGPKAKVRYLLTDVIAWEERRRAHVPEQGTVEAAYERTKAS